METFSAKFIQMKYGFTRQQLHYWYTHGLIDPPSKIGSKYSTCRYGLADLRVLKTILELKESGFSTYKIRKCYHNIKLYFPEISNPFIGKPIIVFGKTIVFIHEGKGYDAFTGQMLLLDFKKVKRWVGDVILFDGGEKYKNTSMILKVQSNC